MTDGPEVVIVGDDGTEHVFPAGFDPMKAAAIVRGDQTAPRASESPEMPSSNAALSLASGAKATPMAANLAERFFTSPTLPKTSALMGRIIGAAAPIAGGASIGGIGGAVVGASEAARGSWVGGRTGYFTGKLLQNMSEPVAKGLRAAVPVAEAAGKAAGPQGLLDLAQMAEPNRRDIGTLGIGPSVHVPGEEPPYLNELYRRLMAKIRGGQ